MAVPRPSLPSPPRPSLSRPALPSVPRPSAPAASPRALFARLRPSAETRFLALAVAAVVTGWAFVAGAAYAVARGVRAL